MPRIIKTETRYEEHRDCRTAEQMTELCCEQAAALPCCEEVEPEWNGYSEEEVLKSLGITLDAAGRDGRGRLVEIQFELREKPCGEMVTKYDLSGGNCCDEIEPIVWNVEATPDLLPHGGEIWLYASGGIPPYAFSVTSHALSFDDGHRSWISDAPYARLHAGATFCGAAVVRVSDGCSTTEWIIRSDLGHWELIGAECVFPDATDWVGDPNYSYDELREKISGMYKQVESLDFDYWQADSVRCPVENGDPADRCLPDCGPSLVAHLESLRPAGVVHSPCMYANVAENRGWDNFGTLMDGASAVVHPTYATSFGCDGTGGLVGSGATPLFIAAYYTSENLYAYKWVC